MFMSTPKIPPFTPERYTDEYRGVADLARSLPWDAGRAARVVTSATNLMNIAATVPQKTGAVEQFLKQYPLSTPEGVGLIGLAEALLRVPDDATADALIRDKVASGAWAVRAESDDRLVQASRFGLAATKMTLNSFLSRAGAPVIRRAFRRGVRMMGKQFVLGGTVTDATWNARGEIAKGYALSFDMLGEGARTLDDAQRYMDAYVTGLAATARAQADGRLKTGRDGISVKLSALHPRFHPLQEDICRPVLTDRLLQLAQLAKTHDLTLTVDAEETERLTLSLQIIADVASHPSLIGWNGFGLAVQAYQKYAPDLIDHVIKMAHETRHVLRVRLVKGAYWDTEIKRAQVMGLPDYPVWTRKCNTDLSYLVCAQKLLAAGSAVHPMFATHNAHTVAAVLDLAAGRRTGFEFQRLQGMGSAVHDVMMQGTGVASTIYAPVGPQTELLAYLVRRLMENGANTSFVHQMADSNVTITDPVETALRHATRRHAHLPLPQNLYGARKNSRGVDVAQTVERLALLAVPPAQNFSMRPARDSNERDIQAAVTQAKNAFQNWSSQTASARADILERFADLMEENAGILMRLLATEGFKTIYDAQGEIREAVDFARYYGAEARAKFGPVGISFPGPTGESNVMTLHGRGVFACISPWNFPLAIFVGQVTAALAAGNTVVAKPAEQTPRVAMMAVHLLHQAGVPKDAVQLVIGDGRVGGMITSHPDIAGVAFTGSTEVARLINRTLAAKDGPIVPLVAETGGQNAMIVDTTALPEQVVDDVILSAFGSAGQRCSALRVLYVQDGIADKLIEMIAGAVSLLHVGDPVDPRTDIGPVIDEAAHKNLVDHLEFLKTIDAKMVASAPLASGLSKNYYFAPCAFEIGSIRQLRGEVFGPVLHIVRFAPRDLPRVMADIAATGYGLTFGLHTRIDGRMADIAHAAPAGNVYINRSQIGAVVGVQPFGGQGLSGTGPKAGGPHYLLRFAHEKVITRNTAASGGNIALISLED